MDSYFFVRFLRFVIRMLLPIWLISWAVLMPVTSVNTSSPGHSGLDIFVFGNVSSSRQSRYAAHLILAWLFTFWILWNLRREMQYFVTMRQRWLVDAKNATLPQASTVLITGVPQKYLTESALDDLFSVLPGGVRKVWLNRDLKEMPDLYKRQLKACNKLESAETKLLGTATKMHNKRTKAGAKAAKKSSKEAPSDDRHLTDASTVDSERNDPYSLVPPAKRPSHRLPPMSFLPFSLPFMGKKVDSIEWARDEIIQTSTALEHSRSILADDISSSSTLPVASTNHPDSLNPIDESQTYQPLNAAFILFNRQIAAHLAAQTLTHHAPYRMTKRWAATVALIIFWALPVAFVGAVSNVHSLCNTFGWLAWICKLPGVVVGIISGILPPVLLAVLMMFLPIVLRMLARFEGMPTKTAVELSLMSRYFLFQVLHSFLIVTVAAGIIAALPGLINSPGSIPTLLAQNLPQASNFFLTYIVLQGLSGTASGFLQISPLVLYYVKLFILGSTPRSVHNIKFGTRSVSWGTLFPSTTLLVVITITYSIISPIINGLTCAAFFLFYHLWKYLFLWQLDQPRSSDTGGLFFPKALQHVFVGLYIQQICLAALFFLAQDQNMKQSAIPEGALMVVLIVLTAGYHLTLNDSYGPLISAVPLTLSDKAKSPSVPQPDDTKRTQYTENASVDDADQAADVCEEFTNPAATEPQRIVWIPRDTLGLADMEVTTGNASGVAMSVERARMDQKGKVDVEGPPPDEELNVRA
ncbi:hypothetical protein EW026_g4428 [Hermanssonia centrifuga]|uniref:DUF221-domain-containing protein n=1 Tax=Hermanssonia centrifuga TaxID=98765 RepID=A0A4V3XAC8_9APHY|nr:hypothetical protein EW026_g4428 [Hermanssonia centrifuga]